MSTSKHEEICLRPWGNYLVIYEDEKCKVKRIIVDPGQQLSLQSHEYRDELWKLISGQWEIALQYYPYRDNPLRYYDYAYNAYIPRKAKHRIRNTGKEPLVIIEIQTGLSFDENDIIRYADDYGRLS